MKVSITNKHRGLGKELSSRFDNVVEGFSEDSDVFINNRHNSFNQSKLLMSAFDKWKDTDKTIVNIGSRSKYPNISKSNKNNLESQGISLLIETNKDRKSTVKNSVVNNPLLHYLRYGKDEGFEADIYGIIYKSNNRTIYDGKPFIFNLIFIKFFFLKINI